MNWMNQPATDASARQLRRKIWIACLVSISLVLPVMSESVRPLEKRESWSFGDETAWQWEGTGAETTLRLTKQSDYKPKVRSPFNIAWFDSTNWKSFTLTAEVRLDLFNRGNNDVCIAFAKASDTRFYYAHLGQNADAVHLHLHLVDEADRKAITQSRAESLPWKPENWHQVKLVRDVESGVIRVWFDGEEVLTASDKTLAEGKIGLGSFDDLASFRNVEITEVAEVSP